MSSSIKKVISYFMIALVMVFTIIALLGIWEVISLEDVLMKLFKSLMVVFAAAAVVLFVFTVLIKDQEH